MMTRRAITLYALVCAGTIDAKKHDKGRGYVEFGPGDRAIVYEYYRPERERLPPGIAKQLRKKGRLPPGLEKKLRPFPVELERRLPPVAPGYYRGFIDDRAVIYDPRSRVIIDVMIVVP
jgi:hypothetical protein